MTARPNKPASVATAVEVRRVAVISAQDLVQSNAYSQIDPLSIPEVKVWLRVDQASDSGTLTIPDAKGGASAIQATGARKPTLSTTGNGLAKLVNAADRYLQLAISTGINNADYFGMGFWCKPTAIGTAGDFFNITRTGAAGLADVDRMSFRKSGTGNNDMTTFIWLPPAPSSNTRQAQSSRAVFLANTWKFIAYEYHGAQATEAARSRFRDMGMPLANPQVTSYSQSAGTATDTPSTLITATTGSAILFNRTTAAAAGFVGEIGPDVFFYDPRTLTDLQRVQMAQFRVPLD